MIPRTSREHVPGGRMPPRNKGLMQLVAYGEERPQDPEPHELASPHSPPQSRAFPPDQSRREDRILKEMQEWIETGRDPGGKAPMREVDDQANGGQSRNPVQDGPHVATIATTESTASATRLPTTLK